MNNADIHVGPEHFAVFKEITKEDLEDHIKIFFGTVLENQQFCIQSKIVVQALP